MPRASRKARNWLMTAVRQAMESLKVELVIGLDRNKAHVLASDRFSIQEVVLVRLHERLHELSWDEPDIVALCSEG
jgi:hypothetical protein